MVAHFHFTCFYFTINALPHPLLYLVELSSCILVALGRQTLEGRVNFPLTGLMQVLHNNHLMNASKEALIITCLHKDLHFENILFDKVKWLMPSSLIHFLAFVCIYKTHTGTFVSMCGNSWPVEIHRELAREVLIIVYGGGLLCN